MATFQNRSRYTVTIKNRTDMFREFSFDQLEAATAYAASIKAQGLKPRLAQKEDAIHVRIRQKGHPDFSDTFESPQAAEDAVHRIEAERRSGLFIDYTKAHKVTFEALLHRYIKEEGPKKKGWEKSEKYKCNGWLEDLDGGLKKRIAKRDTEMDNFGASATPRGAMREPTDAVQWMRKPFATIETTDIEDYIRERLTVVAASTVDREIDILSSIFKVAINVWKYRVNDSPMLGVRRPKYFNERDRRLKSGEEERLLASAREEDRLRSIDLRTEELMAQARKEAASIPTTYARKNFIKQALADCRDKAANDYTHVALYESYIQFQIMTAARRGESLGLVWSNVDIEARTAFLPMTKNGTSRKLPLRQALVDLLQTLPKESARVFTMTVDGLKKAWARIVERAEITDLNVHDLRHEGISLVAETSKFSLIDLQAFSGHRDVRMLLRYAHLCTTQLAHKLDEAFKEDDDNREMSTVHRGRKRTRTGHGLSIQEIVADGPKNDVGPLRSKSEHTASKTKTSAHVIQLFPKRVA